MFLKVPQKESEWQDIINEFELKWNFPSCIGAIDGKHVVIQCPSNTGSQYFNYKGTFSIMLLALVDGNYNFTCIDIGSYGSQSDGGIFAKSNLMKAIETKQLKIPENSVIVGDDAFPLKSYLMKPYPRRFQQTDREKIYNYRHCRARRIVENAFGILASRFRVFRKPILLAPQTTVKLIKASCALHNWIRKSNSTSSISVDIEDYESGNIIPGTWRNDVGSEGIIPLRATQERNFMHEARQKREEFADYFIGEGAVNWQHKMIN